MYLTRANNVFFVRTIYYKSPILFFRCCTCSSCPVTPCCGEKIYPEYFNTLLFKLVLIARNQGGGAACAHGGRGDWLVSAQENGRAGARGNVSQAPSWPKVTTFSRDWARATTAVVAVSSLSKFPAAAAGMLR